MAIFSLFTTESYIEAAQGTDNDAHAEGGGIGGGGGGIVMTEG
jgi:hypothetical protein